MQAKKQFILVRWLKQWLDDRIDQRVDRYMRAREWSDVPTQPVNKHAPNTDPNLTITGMMPACQVLGIRPIKAYIKLTEMGKRPTQTTLH